MRGEGRGERERGEGRGERERGEEKLASLLTLNQASGNALRRSEGGFGCALSRGSEGGERRGAIGACLV